MRRRGTAQQNNLEIIRDFDIKKKLRNWDDFFNERVFGVENYLEKNLEINIKIAFQSVPFSSRDFPQQAVSLSLQVHAEIRRKATLHTPQLFYYEVLNARGYSF